jgi:transcriptional regulator with XRE-family HTH domain
VADWNLCQNYDISKMRQISVSRPRWAQRLSALRTLSGLTQSAVCKELGISQQRYAAYETGRAEPSIALWLQLSELYGTTVDQIMRDPRPAGKT